MLAAALMLSTRTACFADELYWVVGNHAIDKCEIVASNPMVAGDIWFEDGPYRVTRRRKASPLDHSGLPEGRSASR
jgi:hypothetical protein